MTTSIEVSRHAPCGLVRDLFAALAAFGLLVAPSTLAQTPANPTVPAFLPMASAVPRTQPLAIDGTWTITSIGKRIRIEAGRAYAVDPWVHMFVLQIQPGMVVLEDLRSTSPGHYVGKDLPLMGTLHAELTPDGNLSVSVAGVLGPARYELMPVELDNRPWFTREAKGETRLSAPAAPEPNQPPVNNPPAAGQPAPPMASRPAPPVTGQAAPPVAKEMDWTAGTYPAAIPPEPKDVPPPVNALLPERAAPLRVGRAKSMGCGTLTDNLYFSLHNGGECWSCPHGYARDPAATVTSPHACAKRNGLGVGKFVEGPFKRATFVRTAAGCEKGDFRVSDGDCMRCPAGYEREGVLGLDTKTCRRIESAEELLRDDSKLVAKELAPELLGLRAIQACLSNRDALNALTVAIRHRDAKAATAVRDRCLPPATLEALRKIPSGALTGGSSGSQEQLVKTLSVSISASAMLGVGIGVGTGVSWDLTDHHRGVHYFTTGEGDFGWGAGAGVNVLQVEYGFSLLPAGPEARRGVSVVCGGKVFSGLLFSIDYARDSRRLILSAKDLPSFRSQALEGVTEGGGVGANGELGTFHNTLTKYW